MQKLKEIYDIKKQIVTKDINELGNILKENCDIEIVDVNSDNTIYLESNCGMDSIKHNLDKGIKKWLWVDQNTTLPIMINILPIGINSCIIRS